MRRISFCSLLPFPALREITIARKEMIRGVKNEKDFFLFFAFFPALREIELPAKK